MTRLRRTLRRTVPVAAWYVGVTVGWLLVAGCRRTDLDAHPGPAACKWRTAPVGDPGMLECDDCLAGRDPFDDIDTDDQDCTHCGGEGWQESDDPLWDEADIIPCRACYGSGNGRDQWVW